MLYSTGKSIPFYLKFQKDLDGGFILTQLSNYLRKRILKLTILTLFWLEST